MTIKVTCRNIRSFDKDSGKYVHCNHEITVARDRAGTSIKCPACGSAVEVIPSEPEALPTPKQIEDVDYGEIETASTQTNWTVGAPAQPKPRRSKSQIPCINCHQPIPRSAPMCPECGYEQPPAPEPTPDSTGFRLWFSEQLSEGNSTQGVLILMAVFFGLMTLICVSYSIISFGPLAYLLMVPLLLIAVACCIVVMASRKPDESLLATVQRTLHPWSGVLMLNRAFAWRQHSFPFQKRMVLDCRDGQLTDEDLINRDDLSSYQVLDLEGTTISDEGLEQLEQMKKLNFLVVRRTQVTREGVQRLQAARPKLWIWL